MAWVVAPADELKANPKYLDSYKTEIEGALQQIKADLASMSQATGNMNTHTAPASVGLQEPLPIVSIFGSTSVVSPTTPAYQSSSGMQQQQNGAYPTRGTADLNQPPPPSNSAVAYAAVGSPAQTQSPPPSMTPNLTSPPPVLFSNGSPPPTQISSEVRIAQ